MTLLFNSRKNRLKTGQMLHLYCNSHSNRKSMILNSTNTDHASAVAKLSLQQTKKHRFLYNKQISCSNCCSTLITLCEACFPIKLIDHTPAVAHILNNRRSMVLNKLIETMFMQSFNSPNNRRCIVFPQNFQIPCHSCCSTLITTG